MRVSGPLKSATAFRTISEVSTDLDVPQHVLRFWEGKFPQIRPLKRGGGRRYYRPEDVELLRRIQSLLYREGYTIRGAQRLLQDGPEMDPQHFPSFADSQSDPLDDGPTHARTGEGAADQAAAAPSGPVKGGKAKDERAAALSPADIHDLDINPVLSRQPLPPSDRLDPLHRHVLTELLSDLKEAQRLVAMVTAKK